MPTGICIGKRQAGRTGSGKLSGEIQQPCRGAAQDIGLVVVGERFRRENMAYWIQLKGIGIVAAQQDLLAPTWATR
jgi:hypothetical protein